MRRIVSVLLFLLGALALVIGVGKVSFWSPAPTLSASVPTGVQDAPITLLTQDLRTATAGDATLTVHTSGKFVSAIGSAKDVDAWVADAAANVVTGVDRSSHTFAVTHRNGVASTPDPRGSDLWFDEQEHEGDWEASWKVPAQGEWTLLLATDGKQAAPMNISMTWNNPAAEAGAKWRTALPWLIGGVLALALGALFLMSPRNKRKRRSDVTASPRRAARLAAETGQLPVVTPAVASHAAAQPDAQLPPADGVADQNAAAAAENAPFDDDATMIHPRLIAEDPADADADADAAAASDDPDATIIRPGAPEPEEPTQTLEQLAQDAEGDVDAEQPQDSDSDSEDSDSDSNEPPAGGGGSTGAQEDPVTAQHPSLETPDQAESADRPAQDEAPRRRRRDERGLSRRMVRFGAAVLATIGLTIPAGAAFADESATPGASSTAPVSCVHTIYHFSRSTRLDI